MIGMNEAEREAIDRLHRPAVSMKKKPKAASEFKLPPNDIPEEVHQRAKRIAEALMRKPVSKQK